MFCKINYKKLTGWFYGKIYNHLFNNAGIIESNDATYLKL